MELTKKIVFTVNGQTAVAHMGDSAVSYEEEAKAIVPTGTKYQLIDGENLPNSRIFRNAWMETSGAVGVDLESARVIAHDYRRLSRDIEMKPLDLKATIPGEMETAEVSRADLRIQYADIQTQLDEAKTVEELEILTKNLKYFQR